jgi:RNA polymerase sigma factor (sigma-70 family)
MAELAPLDLVQSYLDTRARGAAGTSDETSAWDKFYATHDPVIRAVIRRGVADSGDADDLDQDVWVAVIRRLPKLTVDTGRGTLNAWVATVARHRTARHARIRLRRRTEALTDELAGLLLDSADGAEATLEQRQRQEQVRSVIMKLVGDLSETNRQIVILHWVHGKPLSAIAAELGLSEDRVWSTVRATRPKLLGLLRRAGLDGGTKEV